VVKLLAFALAAAIQFAVAQFRVPAQPFTEPLPAAARGLHCPSGGRTIGSAVGKSYILQELEIDTREATPRLVGFVYSGADGRDYVDFTPSSAGEKTRLMQTGDIDRDTMMMRYCFAGPWDGARTATR
jgi:hypothetical protein